MIIKRLAELPKGVAWRLYTGKLPVGIVADFEYFNDVFMMYFVGNWVLTNGKNGVRII
jgi:hypothetical protein